MDSKNIDVPQLIPKSSLKNMSFDELSFLYEKTMNQYMSTYKKQLSNYSQSMPPDGLKSYMKSLEILETNLDTINNQITLYIEDGDPNYFSNLATAYKNSQTINKDYNKLRDMRKEILQKTYQYQPSLEVTSTFVKQSNHLYLLIFGLLFLIIYLFVYRYYGSFNKGTGQTGGARGKNYLLLFVLFIVLAIILKFLS
jgi:hypothetical protein